MPRLAAVLLVFSCNVNASAAQVLGPVAAPAVVPERPKILPNRWQENWSALADPRIERERFDNLKYIRLKNHDPQTYLSLGLNARERVESNRGEFFGVAPSYEGEWLLSRVEAHADLRLGKHIQVFTQIQSAYALGKSVRAPIDQNRIDVEQAFVGITHVLGGGTLTVRAGRQLIDVDLQRFMSMRDGPNLRQPHDAALLEYRRGGWRLGGLYSQPVQTRDRRPFDDYSDRRLTASGLLIRRPVMGSSQVSVYYLRYRLDAARFTSASGDERRESVDVRLSGAANGFDWDLEAMNQRGRVGSQAIGAWAFGSIVGYTFSQTRWTPNLGLGLNAASGDRQPSDDRLETFNPLFPNGYFLAGYTGYVNFIQTKPAVTLQPVTDLIVTVALATQWRATTGDAVYTFPSVPVAGTAGRPGRYTGTYGELRADWMLTTNYAIGVAAVHYAIGSAVRHAGGHDADYLGVELRYAW
jgi:hypothetical protein